MIPDSINSRSQDQQRLRPYKKISLSICIIQSVNMGIKSITVATMPNIQSKDDL